MFKKALLVSALGCALFVPSLVSAETLSVRSVTPNPLGAFEKLYVLNGNTIANEKMTLDRSPAAVMMKEGETRNVRILHINDIHARLVEYHRKGDAHRMAQIAKIVKDARKSAESNNEAVLFLSIGDEHIGTVWDELLGANEDEFQMSAPYHALSAAGLDVAAVGNHELDKGSALLARAIEQDADFPVLTANLKGSKHNMPWAPAAIGVVNGVRVGIVGLTSVIDTYLETEADPGLKGYNPAVVAANVVSALNDHVDMIVIASHVGYNGKLPGDQTAKYDLKMGDVQIAEAVAKVATKPALLLGGHTHTVLNKDGFSNDTIIKEIPVAQVGEYGRYVGNTTVSLTMGKGGKVTAEYGTGLIATKGRKTETEADYDVDYQKNILDPIKLRLDERLKAPIGRVVKFEGLDDAKVIEDRYVGESAIANFMNDAIVVRSMHWPTGQVDFAAFNATGMRGVDMNGDLTYAEWYSVMPYADEVLVYEMSGAEIKDLVEDNARRILRPEELKKNGGPLDPSNFISRGFQHYSSGIRYEINMGANVMETKAVNITLNGEPIEKVLDKKFKMVFNSYVSHGREGYDGGAIKGLPPEIKGFNLEALRKERAKNTYLLYRGQIIDYIQADAKGVVGPETGAKYDQRVVVRGASVN
ncbi:bifunctional metallophosphatase/5'-nucleotidase [Sneathiella sp. P13V-1]|uniref:bifunctional metallophosphatase/5'-nucleotidase n=1 Tax=Sneathiella sp. P13V-1 TaxID=2697366 RepID=UPI00187B870B|nr:5'-nucleotidase C-terminal domain-containing protein [Sneathiella sp. P13V-1]MBE7636629.1 bifunctional metallophosphatase/5'-nucleotidase [Sneathiella sp. P13V-1]